MRRSLAGILNVHKPAGLSSRRVVDRVVRLVRPAKAGHAGTLDPLATGVLVVCVGRATRLIPFVQEQPKTYRATFLLGRTSPTDDVTGELTEHPGAASVTRAQLEELLPRFTGRIEQVPPQYSAVHVAGQRAYRLARRGAEVELSARPVDVYRLVLAAFAPPEFELEIECGSGTYVRSIGRDLGERLGCGAVLSTLVRTRIGRFSIEEAVPLAELETRPLDDLLQPPRVAVAHLPSYVVSSAERRALDTGRPFPPSGGGTFEDLASVAVLDPNGELVCVAAYDAENRVLRRRAPRR